MSSRQINCPNCGSRVPASDINIAAMMGKCSECDHVFAIDLPGDAPEFYQSTQMDRSQEGPPSRPSGLTHETGPMGEMIIRRSWFHAALFFLLFFCIAWDGFLVFWYSMALFGGPNAGGFQWITVLFPIGHVAVGVGLTYTVLTGFLNKTSVTLDDMTLRVKHGPLPWRGNHRLRREEILEIEMQHGTFTQNRGMMPTLSMTVGVHHQDGQQVTLLKNIPQQQADYIAWHLANELKVPLRRKNSDAQPLVTFLQGFRSGN